VPRAIAPKFDLLERHYGGLGEAMVRPLRKRAEQLLRHQLAARTALGIYVAIWERPEPAAVEFGRVDAQHRDEASARVVWLEHGYLGRE
jgi:hypothetical protein